MDIKLIAIDMDGTLLNSSNKLTERTKKAIAMAKKKTLKWYLQQEESLNLPCIMQTY